jgi:hypothetical protein
LTSHGAMCSTVRHGLSSGTYATGAGVRLASSAVTAAAAA